MLSLFAVAVLAQAPTVPFTHDVAVITTSRSDDAARAHVERALASTRTALRSAGLEVQAEAETRRRLGGQAAEECRQNLACYALLGRSVGVSIVVKVDASVVETDLAFAAQAIDSASAEVLAQVTELTTTRATEAEIAEVIAPFAAKVKQRAPKRAEAQDALKTPVASAADPTRPPGVTELQAPPPPPKEPSRAAAFIPAGIGAASLIAGGLLLNDARWVHERFVGPEGLPISAQEGADLVQRGERSQTLGFIFTGLGVAGLATGAVLYFTTGADAGPSAAVTVTPAGAFAAGAF